MAVWFFKFHFRPETLCMLILTNFGSKCCNFYAMGIRFLKIKGLNLQQKIDNPSIAKIQFFSPESQCQLPQNMTKRILG